MLTATLDILFSKSREFKIFFYNRRLLFSTMNREQKDRLFNSVIIEGQ